MSRPHHLNQTVRGAILLAVTLGLAGCASSPAPVAPAPPVAPTAPAASAPPAAPAVTPSPPAVPALPAKPATVIGSEETSTLLDNFTAYVASVDGQPIAAGRAGWSVPVALPPGPHRLKVAFNRGVFAAEAELSLSARPGAAYEVKFSTDAELFGRNSYCDFWIVDTGSGEAVTSRVRTALARREKAAGT